MLHEVPASQSPNEPRRRWFVGGDIELIVWVAGDDTIAGFQLCYQRADAERALTWTPEHGFRHDAVDEGEDSPEKNQTPILVADGAVDAGALRLQFLANSAAIDPRIRDFVADKLGHLIR